MTSLIVAQPSAADPRVVPDGEGYRIEIPAHDPRDAAAMVARVEAQAATLCGARRVRWGQFESAASGDGAGILTRIKPSTKSFDCVYDAAGDGVTIAQVPADWQADEAEAAAANRLFDRYWAAITAGDLPTARAMIVPETVGDPAWWDRQAASIPRLDRTIVRTTWYVNPDNAPRPGVYVALDYRGGDPAGKIECGYLVLYRTGARQFVIARTEASRLDADATASLKDGFVANYCRG